MLDFLHLSLFENQIPSKKKFGNGNGFYFRQMSEEKLLNMKTLNLLSDQKQNTFWGSKQIK
jgi:hypothetical protein